MVKTSHFYYRGCEFDPWWGTKIPHALRHSQRILIIRKKKSRREFPGGLVIRSSCFHCHGPCSVPAWESDIPETMQRSQKTKQESRDPRGKRRGWCSNRWGSRNGHLSGWHLSQDLTEVGEEPLGCWEEWSRQRAEPVQRP